MSDDREYIDRIESGASFRELGLDIEPPPEPTDKERASVSALARLVLLRRQSVIDLTSRLKAELDDLRRLEEQDLPVALQAIDQSKLALADGTLVTLKTSLRSGQVEDPARIAWVEANGGATLIRCAITIEFDATDADKANALYAELRSHRFANRFKTFGLTKMIPWNTMTKWCGELIAALADPPLEQLGVQRVTRAIVGRQPKTVDLKGLADR